MRISDWSSDVCSSDLLGHWRLHLVILGVTFLAFPVFVVLLQMLMPGFVAQPLWAGMLFLAALPSTVQSSIAFTSMARGNVAGEIGKGSWRERVCKYV